MASRSSSGIEAHDDAGKLRRAIRAHKRSFSRATVTSLAATVVDFSSLYTLVEYAHIYYVTATALAAVAGAFTNFTLNRIWAFNDHAGEHPARQGARYALVSGGSLALNTALVFCFTEFGGLRYLVSKGIAALVVGWGWNYPLHRYFVFRKSRHKGKQLHVSP